ncbi:MAG: nucleotide exchange factor GrpE [Candidatus Aminicenantes bacterium]|nr:MAG: nucleotide exchange factor GrpE [Candidatus Aminicenantes bacterium]
MSEKSKKEKKDNGEGLVEVEYITESSKGPRESSQKVNQIKSLKARLKKKETEIKNLKKKFEKMQEEFLRKAAEMENLRKRLEREKSDFLQYALSEHLKELLGVMDNFERALESNNQGEEESLHKGVEMIHKQLYDLLLKQGVKQIAIEENRYDPHLHQAFLTEESDQVTELQVAEELQKGYTIHDRLLRPSLVKVYIPKKEEK